MAILGYNKFDLAKWLETRGLAGWLEIATDDLQAPDKQRIAHEIEAHYAEAVSTHMAAGELELSAQTTALADLGDPQVASRNFQKSHLTEPEAKSMQWMERMAAKPFFSFRMLPVDLMPLGGLFLLFLQYFWIFAGLLIAFAGFRLIPRLLCARTVPRISLLKELALSTSLTQVAFWVYLALFNYSINHDIYLSGLWGLYLVLIGTAKSTSPLRIWNKLRKMGDERNDLPPQKTTAS